jgi:hypothetical protein
MKMSPGSFPSHGILGVRTNKTPMPVITRPVIMRIFPRLDKGLMVVRLLRVYDKLKVFSGLVKVVTA